MDMFENLTLKNALLFAVQHYENPQCVSLVEFHEDYKRFKYVKRLCRRYVTSGVISEQLMLNHLILLINVFGVSATVRLLFLKCDDLASRKVLKSFLVYLNMLPELVCGVDGKDINTLTIPFDAVLVSRLRSI